MSGPAHTVTHGPKSRLPRFVRSFSPDFWRFFAGASCFDFGIGLFFFLFNLYLTDLHFDERAIGRIVACVTLGNILGTLPATLLARKRGLRPLLIVVFVAAPCMCAMRVTAAGEAMQMLLALGTGAALCGWPISFSPAIAKLTSEANRPRGFSLAFATGIGLGSLAGLAGGYLPEWLGKSSAQMPLLSGMRIALLGGCAIALMGTIPVWGMRLAHRTTAIRGTLFHPYLKRFLPAFLLWNAVTGSFPVFGAVYLQKVLGMPLGKVGAVFAASQLAQFIAVLAAPALSKRVGVARGVSIAQLGTAVSVVLIVLSHSLPLAVCLYIAYFAAQFMCSPGIYQLLMDSVPEQDRSTASAVQNLTGAVCQMTTAALTGLCIVRFGYSNVMLANAAFALLSAACFLLLGRATQPAASDIGHQMALRNPEQDEAAALKCMEIECPQ